MTVKIIVATPQDVDFCHWLPECREANTGLLDGSVPSILTLMLSPSPTGPKATGRYLFSHVNYLQRNLGDYCCPYGNSLSFAACSSLYFTALRVQPWTAPTLGRGCFSQCGREVGLVFRPLLAVKGENGDWIWNPKRLRASLVVCHLSIQFLGLQKFAVCS